MVYIVVSTLTRVWPWHVCTRPSDKLRKLDKGVLQVHCSAKELEKNKEKGSCERCTHQRNRAKNKEKVLKGNFFMYNNFISNH